jgi:diadenosine tetraphosphate (Ap4A) HIT family hydrolase
MGCDFCELPDVKERIIVKNNYAMAFPTNKPIVSGHVLVCPVRCVSRMDELNHNETQAMIDLIKTMKKALERTYGADGFNYAWNEGSAAGQSVPHLHIHVIPRRKGDSKAFGGEPREFLYRPSAERKLVSDEELQAVARNIRNSIDLQQQ